MTTKDYVIIALLAVGGIAAGLWLRGYSDQKGWTTPV